MRVFSKWSGNGNPILLGIMSTEEAELYNTDTKTTEDVHLFSVGLLIFQIDFVW